MFRLQLNSTTQAIGDFFLKKLANFDGLQVTFLIGFKFSMGEGGTREWEQVSYYFTQIVPY